MARKKKIIIEDAPEEIEGMEPGIDTEIGLELSEPDVPLPDPVQLPPKRQLTEAQLRALAKGRKNSLEKRKKLSLLRNVEKLKEKAQFDEEWMKMKNGVLNVAASKTPDPSEDLPDASMPDPSPTPAPAPAPAPRAAKKSKEPLRLDEFDATPHMKEDPIDYKQEYYRMKLDLLHQQHQKKAKEEEYLASYSRAPPQVHAYDIARHSLRSKANELVYKQAYASLFPNG